MNQKYCPRCETTKSAADFGKATTRKDGLQPYCKACRSNYGKQWYKENTDTQKQRAAASRSPEKRRLALYGLSEIQHQQILKSQQGLCAICKEAPAEHVDHDHTDGRVRGILCPNCNKGLGLFKDNPEALAAAIVYLGVG